MIPVPAEVTEFDNYLTDLVDEMTLKTGEVEDLMSTFNAVFDVRYKGDHSIKSETKATANKFPDIIPPTLNLSKANKSQLGNLDNKLNNAPEGTEPNNLIDNVVKTQDDVKAAAQEVFDAIKALKKTAGKAAGVLSVSGSPAGKAAAMSQNPADSESFASVQAYDSDKKVSTLIGEAQTNMNNLKSAVDSTSNQFNNIATNISNTYSGPLTKDE